MEQRFLKPWELCTGCNGDLLLMFDIKCFEPDDVAPTSALIQLMPEEIRNLLERPGIQERIAQREQWGEEPAAICLVGCKSGYRTAASVGNAYLVYECQNITLQHSPDIADETKGELPLFSPSWLPPRPGPGQFSTGEQKDLAVLSAAAQPFIQNKWEHRDKAGQAAGGLKELSDGGGGDTKTGRKGRKGKGKGKKKSSSVALPRSKKIDEVQMWRCISPGQDLANVNLLHGGMPCAEEKLAGCDKPLFDMGFQVDPSALTEERAATAVAAPLYTSVGYLPCNTIAANPWAVYGEPVAEVCHARCVQPHLEAVGRGDRAAADAAWTAVLAARSEATAWLGSGTECSTMKDLVSCGNTRVRTGALDWTWSGPSDGACDGDTWQMYRQLREGAGDQGQYPALSCADLDPVGFIASYFAANKRQYCTQECPGMWPESRWGSGNVEAAILPQRQYGPLAELKKHTLDLRPHLTGLYRVVPDSECVLTADDFTYELSAGLSSDELRKFTKE